MQAQSNKPLSRLELLRVVDSAEKRALHDTFSIALDLGCTSREAAARLRALARTEVIESWKPDKEYSDPNTYWQVTPDGRTALSAHRGESG